VTKWGRKFYAGVGYSIKAPPPQPTRNGMYGFIFDGDGVCVAHGASRSFVGMTLSQIISVTANDQLDGRELLARFIGAARLGGGWVGYPWRNAPDEPLRSKGAFISLLGSRGIVETQGKGVASVHASVASSGEASRHLVGLAPPSPPLLSTEGRGGGRSDERSAYPPSEELLMSAAHGDASARPLYVGFGFFGGEIGDAEMEQSLPAWQFGNTQFGNGATDHLLPTTPTRVPPSKVAAKAATAELKRELWAALGDKEGGDVTGMQSVVLDRSGRLAACAAEANCWEATELPAGLAAALRDHTMLHIEGIGREA